MKLIDAIHWLELHQLNLITKIMNAEISYTNFDGSQHKTVFTAEQCRRELIDFGYPHARNLTDNECLKAIHEIFNF